MKKHYNLILIDGNFFVYRLLTSLPIFSVQYKSERQKLFLVHNFLYSLQSILKEFSFDTVLICWDSKVNKRKNIYPEYKANRRSKTEDEKLNKINLYELMQYLKDELKTLGEWAVIEKEGYEADDLIAYFSNMCDSNCLIVSNDNDLYQLLDNKIDMFLIKDKKIYTKRDFEDEYLIPVDFWPTVKAFAGDRSDNIKGIYGIGIKTAIKYYLHDVDKLSQLYDENSDLINLNYKIISLPIDEYINLKIPQSYFNYEAWGELFQRNGLKKLNLKDFQNYFEKK